MTELERHTIKKDTYISSSEKGRRDHYLPQGYLRGFIDPARVNEDRPLWKLDVSYNKWSARSTKEVAYEYGFYDYAGDTPELDTLPTADDAFLELENEFHRVREKLISRQFRNWKKELGFLLRYMQMIRARSPLFFAQKEAEGRGLKTWIVDKVHDDGKTLTLRSMEASPPPPEFIKNRTVIHMREEIAKGGDWMWNFNWALRYCDSVAEPFVTAESPLVVLGPVADIGEALKQPETLIWFPLCWQACLVGSIPRFDSGTGKFCTHDMRQFRKMYRQFSHSFLLSPSKLDDITDSSDTLPSS